MLWGELVAALEVYAEQEPPNAQDQFIASIPVFTQNAELRIYRDLDFLSTRTQNALLTFTAGSRTLPLNNIPTSSQVITTDTGIVITTDTGSDISGSGGNFQNPWPVVVEGIAAIIPAGSAPPAGRRVRFLRTSVDMIDMLWPDEAITAVPSVDLAFYAMLSDITAIVCPTPPADYTAEITGTWRPAPMSAANPETWLGDNVPDVLFKACMVEVSAWKQNFGAMSDDPKMAMSWEQAYQDAKRTAMDEEQRRKGQGPGWQAFSSTPLATPPRS